MVQEDLAGTEAGKRLKFEETGIVPMPWQFWCQQGVVWLVQSVCVFQVPGSAC